MRGLEDLNKDELCNRKDLEMHFRVLSICLDSKIRVKISVSKKENKVAGEMRGTN
jgi:hypothetical protein